jgi:dihydropyrimidinase
MSDRVNIGIGKLQSHVQSSQNRIHIKNGKIVNDDSIFEADIFIEGGVIKDIGHNLIVPGGVKTIDAKGKLIIPGGIDAHTHMQMNSNGAVSSDDFYSGTRAALSGGTTMIMDCVTCSHGKSLLEAYEQYRQLADNKVCCDYGLHVIVPHFNDVTAKEMETLVKEKGVNSFLVFLSYPGVYMLEDDEMYDVFRRCREVGALAMVHAENGKLIERRAKELFSQGVTGPEGHYYSHPEECESEAAGRAIALADLANCPLTVVNVASKGTAHKISEARRNGALVSGESLLAALAVDGSNYFDPSWKHAAGFVVSPPLRNDASLPQHLMNHLSSGDLEYVSSAHCVFRTEQRALGKDDFRKIPHGVNGVEDRLSVVWEKGVVSGVIDPCKFVAVTSTNAAKAFNLYPRKGRIAVGSDADIVLWDAEATRTISSKTHHQNVDINIFEGMKCHGVPVTVIAAGQVVLEEVGADLRVTQGAGRFISMPARPTVFAKVVTREKSRQLKPVSREAYQGTVAVAPKFLENIKPAVVPAAVTTVADNTANAATKQVPAAQQNAESYHNRPPTRSGGRHMQDNTFSISGDQIDDKQPVRSSIRTHHPPGGTSSGSLW